MCVYCDCSCEFFPFFPDSGTEKGINRISFFAEKQSSVWNDNDHWGGLTPSGRWTLRELAFVIDFVQTFHDRISRCSQMGDVLNFGGCRISSLLFADDVVPSTSSVVDLQLTVGWLAAVCEVAGLSVRDE